jgi:hypothetical protein
MKYLDGNTGFALWNESDADEHGGPTVKLWAYDDCGESPAVMTPYGGT